MRFKRLWVLPVLAVLASCDEEPGFVPELVVQVSVPTRATTVNRSIGAFTPVTASGGTAPYAYQVSPPLPAGLTLAPATGEVSGTPTVAVSGSYTVTVTDKGSKSKTASFALTVNDEPAATASAGGPRTITAGTTVNFTPVTGTGGTQPYTYDVSPALPAGLTINAATGAVSGNATGSLPETQFTVTVRDAAGATATATFRLAVAPALTTTVAVPTMSCTASVACATFAPVTAVGGSAPLTFSVAPGLPTGLTISATTGAISGTPTAAAPVATYTVTVTDGSGVTSSKTFQLTVNQALTASVAVPAKACTVGQGCAYTPVTGAGGTAPLTYSVTPPLPAGLSLSAATGAISGSPTAAAATQQHTVTVTDAANAQASGSFGLSVSARPVATVAVATKSCTAEATCAFTPVTATGGVAPLVLTVSPALPAGLTFNASTGAITGAPGAAAPQATYTVTATDANGATDAKGFSLTVNSRLTTILAVPSTSCTVNAVCATFTPVTASGGTPPRTFSVSPALPTGLSLSAATGAISGTPTQTVNGTFTITVMDAAGATSSEDFQLVVSGPLTTTVAVAAKACTVGRPCAFTPVTASGGTAPLAYAVTPALPAGLSFSTTTGAISGTPTANAQATYTVTVTDAVAAVSSKTFQLTVNPAPTAATVVPTKACTAGAPCAFTPVTAAGGTTPLVFSVSPALPPGLALNGATGAISGAPTLVAAQTTYTVTVTDANGATASATFQLTVNQALTTLVAVPTTTCTIGVACAFTPVTATGGTPPLAFAVSPALPAGLSMSTTTGAISGTPSASSAQASYTVTVTDAAGASSSKAFQLAVIGPLTTTLVVPAKTCTVGTACPFTPVTASGGTPPLTFAVSPALPAGMSFNTTTGAITGTPSSASALVTYTVTVTDAALASSSKDFDLTVNAAPTATAAVPTKECTAGVSCAYTPVTVGGGTAPLTISLSPSLPAGLSFDTGTGAISGTPGAQSAQASYTVTVTDANGATASANFDLTVNAALVVTTDPQFAQIPCARLPNECVYSGSANVPIVFPIKPVTATGGTGPLVYSIAPTNPLQPALPAADWTFDTSTGELKRTATPLSVAVGPPAQSFTVTVTDANGATASATFLLRVT